MSTFANPSPLSLRAGTVTATNVAAAASAARPAESARGLSILLLAAMVAALVVLADRLISTWADGHLLLAWVFLWVVVFAGMALLADTARTLAARTLQSLDGWSQALAQARADARLWSIAQNDPRLMQELQQAVARDRAEADASSQAYSDALAPLGMTPDVVAPEAARGGWEAFIDRLAEQRSRNVHLYYI
ncbi:MAG: hypothetical protein ACK40L_00285 [Hydrogenophaga sp.]